MPALPHYESRKDSDRPGRRLREGNVAVCPTDDEAVVPRKVDKQSLDYLWRSGTAGGVAGCAVSANNFYTWFLVVGVESSLTGCSTGKNRRCAA